MSLYANVCYINQLIAELLATIVNHINGRKFYRVKGDNYTQLRTHISRLIEITLILGMNFQEFLRKENDQFYEITKFLSLLLSLKRSITLTK